MKEITTTDEDRNGFLSCCGSIRCYRGTPWVTAIQVIAEPSVESTPRAVYSRLESARGVPATY